MHNGVKIVKGSYHGEWMTEIIRELRGHHEPQEEKVFHEVLKKISSNACMLELGSFWAYYSMWFYHEIPNARNFMIEPNIEKMKVGEANFKLNNMDGTFVNGFIGEKSDPNAVFEDWDDIKYKIAQISVDNFVEEYSIPYIDILHSDIQGAEYKMLLGCRKSIAEDKIGYIFISTHSNGIHYKCLKFLADNEFNMIASHNLDEGYAEEGLIVASSKNIVEYEPIEISKRFNIKIYNGTKTLLRIVKRKFKKIFV